MLTDEWKEAIELSQTAIDSFLNVMDQRRAVNNHDLLANYFIGKTITTFYSVCFLCEKGYGEDAMVLSRTMLENLINYSYINREPEENTELFIEFDKVRAKKRLNNYRAIYPEKHIPEEVVETIERNYEEVKEKYKTDSCLQTWSGKNLADMAIKCGLQEYYRIIYPLASSYAHGSVETSVSYINKQGKGYSVRAGQPCDEFTAEAIYAACSILLMLIGETFDLYDIETPDKVNDALFYLGELQKTRDRS
ncbi:MAG: DUF5677 domain-containing protein [Bacillota bacterium]|nr:DUF5677 domain-containing protein [Bacillota bacterium]